MSLAVLVILKVVWRFYINFFLIYIVVNNSSVMYYKKQRTVTIKGSRKISKFSEEIGKKRQYGTKRYKKFPEDEKQSLVEYRKNYYKVWKNASRWKIPLKVLGWSLLLVSSRNNKFFLFYVYIKVFLFNFILNSNNKNYFFL